MAKAYRRASSSGEGGESREDNARRGWTEYLALFAAALATLALSLLVFIFVVAIVVVATGLVRRPPLRSQSLS